MNYLCRKYLIIIVHTVMNFSFKQFLFNENQKMIHVYHVSPKENLWILRPQRSPKQGQSGVYVAPKFIDSVKWFTSYVAYKKGDTQNKNRTHRAAEEGKGWHGKDMQYQTAYIYTIECPKYVLNNAWYETEWEREYFIPENELHKLKVISMKKYTFQELNHINDRYYSLRNDRTRTDVLAVAKEARNNIAARYYLELRDKIFQMKKSLEREVPNNILTNLRDNFGIRYRFVDTTFLQVINRNLKELEPFFIDNGPWRMQKGKPKKTFDNKDLSKVLQIVKIIEFLIINSTKINI